ncbi:hypothetical protein Bca4012_071844 [Brassica carinata]
MNPRVEHCNATKLRYEKAEGKEPEQLSAETAPGAEERTEHPTSSEVTAPDELAETPPVRVYVHKVSYPIPPRHLINPIKHKTGDLIVRAFQLWIEAVQM